MFYAGIGSRETPPDVLELMTAIGEAMARAGHTLRSGAAVGADSKFEMGCDQAGGPKEIFTIDDVIPEWAFAMVDRFHPRPDRLGHKGRRLMARNALQVLGADGETPVGRVICWTPGGQYKGGTSQAMRIADANGIRIDNLGVHATLERYRARIAALATTETDCPDTAALRP